MAKPRVFISSTFYDLRQIRAELDLFVENLGYDPIRNEEGDIPYGKEEALEEYCYKEIKGIDILVSILGGRFGSESKRHAYSISQIELRTALREGKQVYIFIDSNILAEYETYLLNKDSDLDIKYKYVDDTRIYKFIEEIKGLSSNNNIKGFETGSDITKYLKEQFAGLFQRFLEEQTRVREVSIINNLEKTAQTLNKLVNYLSDENKDQTEEINRILTINHPLVEKLRDYLDITYNFYIEGLEDLKQLLIARGFKEVSPEFNENHVLMHAWEKDAGRKHLGLVITSELFDEEGRLRFVKKTDWVEAYTNLVISERPVEEDDLPF
jgi:hypothetical protein